MNSEKFYSEYTDSLKAAYPCLSKQAELNINNLISPHSLTLPKETLESAQKIISSIFKLRNNKEYQQTIYKKEGLNFEQIENNAVLMGYDFHLDENNNLKLIEINTNSAGYLFVDQLYKFKALNLYPSALDDLKQSFFAESPYIKNIAVMDEDISQQKMTLEFNMYKELFSSWGLNSEVVDSDDFSLNSNNELAFENIKYDFIYNRYCDFLLQEENSSSLLKSFSEKTAVFSPNPNEYLLLADKNRLIDWSKPSFLEQFD